MIPYGQETIIGCDKMCQGQTANDRRVSHHLHVLGKYRNIVAHVSWLSNGTQMSATALRQLSQPTFMIATGVPQPGTIFFCTVQVPIPATNGSKKRPNITNSGYLPVKWNESWWEYNYPVNNNRSSTSSTTCLTQWQKHPTPASTGCCRKYRARMRSSWYLAQTPWSESRIIPGITGFASPPRMEILPCLSPKMIVLGLI